MKSYIIGAVVGVAITIAIVSVWSVRSLDSRVKNLESFATQVTQLINSAQQK